MLMLVNLLISLLVKTLTDKIGKYSNYFFDCAKVTTKNMKVESFPYAKFSEEKICDKILFNIVKYWFTVCGSPLYLTRWEDNSYFFIIRQN